MEPVHQLAMARRMQTPDDPTDSGDTAWVLTSTGLVALMIPALAFFYGGLVSQRAVVNTMLLSFICFVTISLTWSLIGYSLAFGPNPGPADGWIGGDAFGAYDSPDKVRIGTDIPEHAYFIFQLMFATITAAVISGSVVQRITLWAWTAFSVVWCMLVYVPLARWIFYTGGWLYTWGVLDFAGGLVVETASGVSAFVLAYWLGPGIAPHSPAHNIPFVLLGVGLLWVGWYGFNGGSALSSGYLSARALTNTHLAACAGMAVWVIIEACLPKLSAMVYEWTRPKPRGARRSWFGGGRQGANGAVAVEDMSTTPSVMAENGVSPAPSPVSSSVSRDSRGGSSPKVTRTMRAPVVPWGSPTAVGAASGCLAGLVAITPGAGMVSQMHAILIGTLTTPLCFITARNLKRFRVDDRLECLPIHGVAGMVGTLFTGVFASKAEGSTQDGLVYGNPIQLWKQFAALLVTLAMCIVGTSLSYWVIRGIGTLTGWQVRVSEESESDMDRSMHGEHAYEHLSLHGGGSHNSGAFGGGHGAHSASGSHAHLVGLQQGASSHAPASPLAHSPAVLPAGVYRMPSLQESRHGAEKPTLVPSSQAHARKAGGGGHHPHRDPNAVEGVDPRIDPTDILTGLGLVVPPLEGGGAGGGEPTVKAGAVRNRSGRPSREEQQHKPAPSSAAAHAPHLDAEAPGMTPADAAAALANAASKAAGCCATGSGGNSARDRADSVSGAFGSLSVPLAAAGVGAGAHEAPVLVAALPHEFSAAPLMTHATDGLK